MTIITDHESFIGAFEKGLSPNCYYNEVIREMMKGPAVWKEANVKHIAGEKMPADEPSRSLLVIPEKLEAAVREMNTAPTRIRFAPVKAPVPILPLMRRGPTAVSEDRTG